MENTVNKIKKTKYAKIPRHTLQAWLAVICQLDSLNALMTLDDNTPSWNIHSKPQADLEEMSTELRAFIKSAKTSW